MSLVIPDEIVRATQFSEQELLQEIAAWLYAEERLTLGQASKFALMSTEAFVSILDAKGIPPHYAAQDLDQDVETLRRLGRI